MDVDGQFKPLVFKQHYEPKANREDGLLLQVHHTAPGPNGDIRRTRFLHASFSPCNELLAVADHRGNIYVVDLPNNVFWLLCKLPFVSTLCFHSHKKYELVVAMENGSEAQTHRIVLINTDTGSQLGSLKGHTQAASKISFNSDGNYCLSISKVEGYIWDLKSLTQAHRLNLQPNMIIKQAFFMPVSDNILACFHDDAIHVWAFQSFQCVKQIIPESWEGCGIESLAFSRNGQAMVLGGKSKQLILFSVDDWDSQQTLHLPESVTGVQHLEFVPQSFDCGANDVIAVLTNCGSLLFIDTIKGTTKCSSLRNIRCFICSWSGRYIACIMMSGEVKIFSGPHFLANAKDLTHVSCRTPADTSCHQEDFYKSPESSKETAKVQYVSKKHQPKLKKQVKISLDLNRLRAILKEFLEYPQQYRNLIWRSILQLPGNREPWNSLYQRPPHPAAQDLLKKNPLQNKVMLNCLQSVISCLAHWSPVFGELPYLPNFVFPFIKMFHSDHFICFEVAATLIVNWCQHWFEYLSFPPVNILGIVENLLSEHDNDLLSFFCKEGITSQQYAWSLLSSAFSEVLSPLQWMQLWDHIISNPPWFFLCAVCAYNSCCRASLKSCTSKDAFELFFRNQNPINMKYFIKKSYEIMEKTSKRNHPSQYLKQFDPLPKGNYPVFSAYPKFIVNYQREQRDAIRHEEELILKEQHAVLSQRLAREETRLRERNARVHELRLLEAEKAATAALQVEEERLIEKRKQLAALRRELRVQDSESLAAARVDLLEQQAQQRSVALDRLHHQLHTKKKLSGLDCEALNEEVHEHYSRLIARKHEVFHKLQKKIPGQLGVPNELENIKHQQQLLSEEIQKLRKESCNHGVKSAGIGLKLTDFDKLQQRQDVARARKLFPWQENLMRDETYCEEARTVSSLNKLEEEVDELTQKLNSYKTENDLHIRCRSNETEARLLNPNRTSFCLQLPQGPGIPVRNSDYYSKEKCAVTAAMELRKSLLSSWTDA